jgi:flagellar biosynthesis chaperone FliJ
MKHNRGEVMKMSISWHRNCLRNRRGWLNERSQALEALKVLVERETKMIAFYESQIDKAEAKGMNGFDEQKFLLKVKS